MSSMVANVWLEIQGINQKMLICLIYHEFNDLTSKLSIENQIERLKIFSLQIEQATKEGMVLAIGDWNIDLEKFEDSKYYLKKLADEYQTMVYVYRLAI